MPIILCLVYCISVFMYSCIFSVGLTNKLHIFSNCVGTLCVDYLHVCYKLIKITGFLILNSLIYKMQC